MAKKRKSDATYLDEIDRSMYNTFCAAANSLSHFYTQATSHHRLSFQAGERHSLEKIYQWMMRKQEEGSRVTTIDIIAYLQNELEYGTEEPLQHQHSQTGMILNKNSIFSNSSSSPLRRNFQHHHLSQGGNGSRSIESNFVNPQNGELNPGICNDSMDMHESSQECHVYSSPCKTHCRNSYIATWQYCAETWPQAFICKRKTHLLTPTYFATTTFIGTRPSQMEISEVIEPYHARAGKHYPWGQSDCKSMFPFHGVCCKRKE